MAHIIALVCIKELPFYKNNYTGNQRQQDTYCKTALFNDCNPNSRAVTRVELKGFDTYQIFFMF